MSEKYILEIPVYRCSPNAYKRELDAERQTFVEAAQREGMDPALAAANFSHQYSAPWRFNQVIGYLRLYVPRTKDALKAEYWRIEQRRIYREQGKKVYRLRRGDALGFWVHDLSSEEIYQTLLQQLKQLNRDRRFRRRYIDVEMLKAAGPYIDWQALVNS